MTNNKGKGKAISGRDSAGKRKVVADDDKTGGGRKRNRSVLQFFEDSACDDDDDSEDSDFADDFLEEEEFDTVQPMMTEPSKGGHGNPPFVPKEEEIDEEEFDRMMEERYGEISKFVTFAGDEFDDKVIDDCLAAGVRDPPIWKVKCTVGRERVSACCLMQKFANLKALGTTLQIISAFAVEHMKGFVYMEAERQSDIYEACKGIPGIYATRVQPIPRNEVPHLFSFKTRSVEISEGMWVRIKSGNYKGDLAQVVAYNNTRKKVTVKLVPRIDLQAMAGKFGGGYKRQKTAIPAPRLISSSELEEFRPLIQLRRDRDTGKVFEVLDGLLLKDGYVFKKVSQESLNLWGVVPTEEELLKFGPSENNESKDLEWLSQLYGESKKKQRVIRNDKGGGKGESSSGSGLENGFELYDLVCFGKKDFGLIVGMDKDDSYKILKENPDGPFVETVELRDIKSGLFDLKLSAQDQHNKTIVVNDTVRVLDGPSQGRQGIVRHIYRGIVFLWDESVEENGGYFTSKSHMCEKVKLTVDDFSGKDGEPGPSVFDDLPSSPRSPLSPKKPWQGKENNREFNRGDNNNLFTIGQTLRIRIGPLKGYLCRVIALRRTDVTVKLDSQQKVLTVKCEHLSEVQGKSTAASTSADPDSSSFKPFDLLGTEGATGGWMSGVGTSTAGDGWNAGGSSTERNAWSNHSAPSLEKPESVNAVVSEDDAVWGAKSTSNQNSSWGAAVQNSVIASDADQAGGSWGQAEHKGNDSDGNQPSGWGQGSGWKSRSSDGTKEVSGWGKIKSGSDVIAEKQDSDWGRASNWNSVSSDAGGSRGDVWGQLNDSTEKKSETDTISCDQDAGKNGSADGMKQASNWGAWKSGSSGNDNKDSNWDSKCADAGSSHSNWGNKTHCGSRDAAKEGSAWGKMKSGLDVMAEKQDSDWGKASNWNSASSGAGGSRGSVWGQLNDSAEKKSETDKTISCDQAGMKQASILGPWKSGSSGNENKDLNWASKSVDAGSSHSNWGNKTSWSSGHSGNQAHDVNDVNSGSGNNSQTSNWGKKSDWNAYNTSCSAGTENKNSNWSSNHNNAENENSSWGKKNNSNYGPGDSNQNSGWGKKSNWNSDNSSGSAGNENKNSNWSSERNDAENQDSSWGKKNKWNSGSVDSNQNSTWGKKSNWNFENSSGSAGNENKNFNWSSDAGNQDSGWGKKSSWNSGSGDKSQGNNWRSNSNWSSGNASGGDNDGLNDTSDDGAGGGNWRGGYRGRGGSERGGFRGRGFRGREGGGFGGRGDRGGFGGRGDRGGFGGRGDRGGFGGRGDRGGRGGRGRSDGEGFGGRWSERGFGGRGRGSNDQSRGWNNRRDSGGDGGSSDWKKEGDNAEGWKNSSGSGSWNREGGERGKQSWSVENTDQERPSWGQGGGSNKQWSSWNSGGGEGGGTWNSGGSKQGQPSAADKGSTGWGQPSAADKGSTGWGQPSAADKGSTGWGQSSAADKGSSGWGQSSAADKGSSGWGQSSAADKGTSGWGQSSAADKGTSGWGQSSGADKGQSSGLNEPADGAAGSWGKKNDGSNKSGW